MNLASHHQAGLQYNPARNMITHPGSTASMPVGMKPITAPHSSMPPTVGGLMRPAPPQKPAHFLSSLHSRDAAQHYIQSHSAARQSVPTHPSSAGSVPQHAARNLTAQPSQMPIGMKPMAGAPPRQAHAAAPTAPHASLQHTASLQQQQQQHQHRDLMAQSLAKKHRTAAPIPSAQHMPMHSQNAPGQPWRPQPNAMPAVVPPSSNRMAAPPPPGHGAAFGIPAQPQSVTPGRIHGMIPNSNPAQAGNALQQRHQAEAPRPHAPPQQRALAMPPTQPMSKPMILGLPTVVGSVNPSFVPSGLGTQTVTPASFAQRPMGSAAFPAYPPHGATSKGGFLSQVSVLGKRRLDHM
jgi:hypothetical protein